ncbi:cortical protein marker for cell polarity-domain-containing protein [Neohortaea acidophila]|uniref:Cortical protein marker for cell polarity-domain-containing protein n=1 Tax=Neohortaea acidophila TaxID=245834 RepID=A0A6A6PS97_9PEZI|nr:cortical protein marker for cell polarity-domain-containing protein [Neohortaea acidophila]KAF2482561.1 cortical protein marker for cell polarity-domain-containing protein [Neohortaea acidophila]
MRNLLSQLLAAGPELAAFILTSPVLFGAKGAYAISFTPAPSPNLDLSQLGRVAVAGDFDSISLWQYTGQSEALLTNNGSQSLLTQFPNGQFETLQTSDASIAAMCQFERNGKVQGVVVGGNFTRLGGVEAQSIALWDSSTNTVSPLTGINGVVSTLYCDNDSGTVYVGGMFSAGNSQNAMSWTTGWENLPFAGFNGPVNSIAKNPAGNIVFGGQFDGLGNTTTAVTPNGQVVNLAGGTISAEGSTSTIAGFEDPSNIICKTGGDGPGNTWLLSDNRGGFWQGTYGFGFIPTKLRLYNTKYQGRGTKSWAFENLANGGYLEFNYTDSSGNTQLCASNCPLPEGNTDAQDFIFTQPVGVDNFRIWINDWYGDGAGFSGIEMFQDDIYSFAINAFNEPNCDGVSNAATSVVNPASGLWNRIPNNGSTNSDYLSAYLTSEAQATSGTSVVFNPNIPQSGNFSITVYTPGCISDGTCATRGSVNLVGTMHPGQPAMTATVTQTNDYDKYDEIYFGSVDLASGFAPSVTLTPVANQALPQTVVAQKVRFQLITTSGGLNGLYEYNPNKATVSMDFSDSAIDSAGTQLAQGAVVNSVVWDSDTGYVGGSFSGKGISNVLSITTKANSLPNGGLNANVETMYLSGSTLYLGGNFTNTADSSVTGLANVASFDTGSNTWTALGAGVDGTVQTIVPVDLNITSGNSETCISISGTFTSVNAVGGSPSFSADGLAVWVPSKNNWLNNIADAAVTVQGELSTSTMVSGLQFPLYAGQASSQALGYSGAAELVGSGQPTLQSFGLKVQDTGSSSSKRKRASDATQDATGIYTGLFYDNNGLNITALGGHFAATGSDGTTVQNLVIVKTTGSSQTVSGVSQLDAKSTVAALAYQDTLLFAGGSISGTVDGNDLNGLVVYNMQTGKVQSPQPPALSGNNVAVNAIAPQDKTSYVYVGGDFTNAGALPCATLCYYDTTQQQWNPVGNGLSGVITAMMWSSKTTLIIAGDLTINGAATKMASYDSKKQTFTAFTNAASLPGQITALTTASSNFDSFWAAGVASNNNSAYLSLYQNGGWTAVGGLGKDTIIRGLQVMELTNSHSSTALVPSNNALVISGNINIPNYGNASAVLFNGTGFEPLLLTTKSDGTPGSVSQLFVSNPTGLLHLGSNHLAVGFVVLIGLAIALAIIFLLVVAGILIERARRRREGYVPMTETRYRGNMSRIPPETLLGKLGEKGSPPKI